MNRLLELFGRTPAAWVNQRTYYQDHVQEPVVHRPALLNGEARSADVCVIGGGLAGLTVALGLAEAGRSVVVLEGNRIGEAASGNNAGMVINGYHLEGSDLVELVGKEVAKNMFRWSVAAQTKLKERIQKYEIKCDVLHAGHVTLSVSGDNLHQYEEEVRLINEMSAQWELWPASRVRQQYRSGMYHHGIYNPHTFSVNPLGLIYGLARACEKEGATIYERTRATGIRRDSGDGLWHVRTESNASTADSKDTKAHGGVVRAKEVVLATNASMTGLCAALDRSLISLWTYIMVTEPLGEARLMETMGSGMQCVCDDRIALAYYRPLSDTRILWGGLASASPLSREEAQAQLRTEMVQAYPQLADIKTEYLWGGAMGWAVSLMPLIGKTEDGMWYTTAYGGHGLVPTSVGADLIVSAILSNDKDKRYEVFSKAFSPTYAGGPFTNIGVAAVLFAYRWRDRYRLWRTTTAH